MTRLDIPDLRTKELLTIIALAEYGSFVAAASHLKTSQPALTRTVKRVERVLGVLLFARNTRRVEITPAGREFVAVAERMLNDLKITSRSLGEIAGEQRGRITVSTYSAFASQTMPPLAKCSSHAAVRRSAIREGCSRHLRDIRIGVADVRLRPHDTAEERSGRFLSSSRCCGAPRDTRAPKLTSVPGRAEGRGADFDAQRDDLPPGRRDGRGVARLQHPLRGDRGPVPHDGGSRQGRRGSRERAERRAAAPAVEGLRGISADRAGARAHRRDDRCRALPLSCRHGAAPFFGTVPVAPTLARSRKRRPSPAGF